MVAGITVDRKEELGFCFIILEVLRLELSQSLNSRSCCLPPECLDCPRIGFIHTTGKDKAENACCPFPGLLDLFLRGIDLLERHLLLCPLWVPFSHIHFAMFIKTVSLHKRVHLLSPQP